MSRTRSLSPSLENDMTLTLSRYSKTVGRVELLSSSANCAPDPGRLN